MAELSPATQVVLDVLNEQLYELNSQHLAAAVAALRAAADQLRFADDYGTWLINADDLLAIADELEGQ